MALSLSHPFPSSPSLRTATCSRSPISAKLSSQAIKPIFTFLKITSKNPRNKNSQPPLTIVNASDEERQQQERDNNETELPAAAANSSEFANESTTTNDELSELGAEIKKAMKERESKGNDMVWSGVLEEIREIEWPAFNKVLGTTGVVLGIIAGSTVVLLTVNAVLAELSDKVFSGRGVQDFF